MSRARPQPSGAPGRTPWSCTVQRTAEVGGWGCQLLYLAIGGCVSNDLFREASACGIRLTTVRVLVRGEFGGDPAVSGEISYEVEIAGDASRMFLGLYARLGLWSMLPNRRCALFYNFWAGKLHPTERVPPPTRRRPQQRALPLGRRDDHRSRRRSVPAGPGQPRDETCRIKTAYGKIVLIP